MRQLRQSIFKSCGDRELWVVKEGDLQLPVFVLPGRTTVYDKDSFLICPAASLEPDQMEWLRRHLDTITSAKVGFSLACGEEQG